MRFNLFSFLFCLAPSSLSLELRQHPSCYDRKIASGNNLNVALLHLSILHFLPNGSFIFIFFFFHFHTIEELFSACALVLQAFTLRKEFKTFFFLHFLLLHTKLWNSLVGQMSQNGISQYLNSHLFVCFFLFGTLQFRE